MATVVDNSAIKVCASSPIVCAHRGGVEIVDGLADEWRTLCTEAVDDQPFFRPEFIRAHIRAVIPGAKVMLLTARLNGRLCLILPLVEELGTFGKVPVRKLRAPVNFNCGRFDAVRKAGPDGDDAIRTTWHYLKRVKSWDLLQIRDTQPESTVGRLVEAARAEGFLTIQEGDRPNPYIPVPADPDLLKRMPPNSKLRSQLRQARNRMVEQAPLNFRRLDKADRDALNRFFELEASGWKGENGSAVNCDGRTRQFFDELAAAAARFGYFSLYMLEWKGELIAAHFSLTYKNRCYSPIVAYNERFKQFAPGHLIVAEILQDCAVRGVQGYDITGQDQPWKMKWTNETHPVNHHFVFKGALGCLAYKVATKLRPAIVRMIPARQKAA
jgi:CelD/BcsL family acetyltransferase involved in cellulose biosynthesis